MTLSLAIVLTLIAVLLSALFSGTEIAFVQSDKVRMEIDASSGGVISRILRTFSNHEDMFISSLLVGNNIVLVIYGIAFSFILDPILMGWFHNEALMLVVNTIVSTGVILVCGEFFPKVTFRINPNAMMRLLALPIYLIYLILYPLSLLCSMISRGFLKLFGIKEESTNDHRLSMDELDDYIQRSIHDTPKEKEDTVENEVKIFRNAIDFKDTQMEACMTPRNEIVAVRIGTDREQLMKTFIATGLSKIVVYDEDIDDILGYIHVSELFDPEADWTTRLKPVIYTPETMLANRMMRRMLAEKRSMAIVVDEFGGTAGLATLEDLVEEIFGEIEDEHDRKKLIGRQLPDGSYEISGRAEIEHINEQFRLQIPEDEEVYHTLAGYILETREELPDEGDTFDIEGLRFTILRKTATRIELVKITPISPADE